MYALDRSAVGAAQRDGIFLDTARPPCHAIGCPAAATLVVLIRSATGLHASGSHCSQEALDSGILFSRAPDTSSNDGGIDSGSAMPSGARLPEIFSGRSSGSGFPLAVSMPISPAAPMLQPGLAAVRQQPVDLDRLQSELPVLGPLADAVFAWTAGGGGSRQRVQQLLQHLCVLPACPYDISAATSIRQSHPPHHSAVCAMRGLHSVTDVTYELVTTQESARRKHPCVAVPLSLKPCATGADVCLTRIVHHSS